MTVCHNFLILFYLDEVEYLSKNVAPMEIGQDEFYLMLMYDDMKVTLVKEFFIYDGIDMVMAVGGILALFLGTVYFKIESSYPKNLLLLSLIVSKLEYFTI